MILTEIEKKLFEINLSNVAKRFNLLDSDIPCLSEAEAANLLNLAEEYSLEITDKYKAKSLLICAFLWENKNPDWLGLRPFISRILIRIGLSTTAKMVGWNTEYNLFNSFGSLIEEVTSTVELIKHEVSIKENKILLSSFQKRMWDGIENYCHIGISAPTSAGKSFVLINKAIQILTQQDGKIFFIVPTISLINQVCNDLRKTLSAYGIQNIDIAQTVNDISLFRADKIIYVLTQERAFSAINHPDNDLSDVVLLIIDEIQNIEKVSAEHEERSKILFDVLQIFKNDIKPSKIIISGPRLHNLDSIVKDWFGKEAVAISEDLPSVINVTYSFVTGRNKLFFKQYIDNETSNSIEIQDNHFIKDKILKRQKYGEEEINFLSLLINRNKGDGNIIFASTTSIANNIAKKLSQKLDSINLSSYTESFTDFVANSVHPMYDLIETLRKGVAYHHSKMPPHIRSLVENLFSEKYINTIVSTTTLMQGVNLPAKNIIIKTPHVGGEGETLTGYEFTNLKGRAGRLMKDFVGRSLIINEKECEKAGIDISHSEQKELKVGFAKKYQEEKDYINAALSENFIANELSNSDLITYIRNICIRYPEKHEERLKEVGINVPKNILDQCLKSLEGLNVPKQICVNNFYWDPLILNNLYNSFISNEWPQLPNNIVFSSAPIKECIIKMASFAPIYYNRYLPDMKFSETSNPIKRIQSLSIFAESYGRGYPLKEVIESKGFKINNSEDIEDRIQSIQTKVVYGIPKLLKPLFQINDLVNEQNFSSILSFIEVGAVDKKLRVLIEIGVPRETAIHLLHVLPHLNLLDSDDRINDKLLSDFFEEVKANTKVNEWHKFIIRDMLYT